MSMSYFYQTTPVSQILDGGVEAKLARRLSEKVEITAPLCLQLRFEPDLNLAMQPNGRDVKSDVLLIRFKKAKLHVRTPI